MLIKVRKKQGQNLEKEILSLLLFTREKGHRSITMNQLFCDTPLSGVVTLVDYSSAIAPVWQAPAQVPQLTQEPASITYWLSPWEIAPTGHSGSQVPQLTQESEITYAILVSSF